MTWIPTFAGFFTQTLQLPRNRSPSTCPLLPNAVLSATRPRIGGIQHLPHFIPAIPLTLHSHAVQDLDNIPELAFNQFLKIGKTYHRIIARTKTPQKYIFTKKNVYHGLGNAKVPPSYGVKIGNLIPCLGSRSASTSETKCVRGSVHCMSQGIPWNRFALGSRVGEVAHFTRTAGARIGENHHPYTKQSLNKAGG